MLVSKIKPCMLQSKSLNEDPLEGKSGASSRGNSSSNSVCTGLLVPSVGDALLALTGRGRASGAVTLKEIRVLKASLRSIIAIVGLQRGIPSKRESSARVDYVPALCTHRPVALPIEWSGEVLGSRRRGRFAAGDVARIPLNLII
ncbi:hypothetical protein L1887_62186 [Cichorium endivia]|nr:hypothetical protein L1887_62186 [Cichorium endivia]